MKKTELISKIQQTGQSKLYIQETWKIRFKNIAEKSVGMKNKGDIMYCIHNQYCLKIE